MIVIPQIKSPLSLYVHVRMCVCVCVCVCVVCTCIRNVVRIISTQ